MYGVDNKDGAAGDEGFASNVTLKPLRNVGIDKFVWIPPSAHHANGRWPHGGFAYFYPQGFENMDCIFALAAGANPEEKVMRASIFERSPTNDSILTRASTNDSLS